MINCNIDGMLQHLRVLEGLKAIKEDVSNEDLLGKLDSLIEEEQNAIDKLTEECGAVNFEDMSINPPGETLDSDIMASLG